MNIRVRLIKWIMEFEGRGMVKGTWENSFRRQIDRTGFLENFSPSKLKRLGSSFGVEEFRARDGHDGTPSFSARIAWFCFRADSSRAIASGVLFYGHPRTY